MSELIKENKTNDMITMTRLRISALLGVVFIVVLFLSTASHVGAYDSGFILSQPDVWAWGIEGEPELGNGFDVWANVTDDGSGLRNVTIQVYGPNMSINNLMTFNGTFHIGSVPPFPNDGTFTARIRAYDMANVTRTSSNVIIDFESDPVITVDPSLTMPIVVGSSVGFIAIVSVIALVYDKKKSLGERNSLPEEDEES